MGNTRRTVRKTQPASGRQPEAQVWPLVIAFCVLGGFLAGTVLAYLRPDDPRWYANAWTYLIAIPLVITSSLLALAVTGNRLLRRTMQLALVLGLICHLGLFIAAIETNVFRRVWTEVLASTSRPLNEKRVKVPEYSPWRHNSRRQAQREFNQPVETDSAEPVVEPTPRKAVQDEPADVSRQPRATPEARPVTRPNVVQRNQVNRSLPRRRDQRSTLSRRHADLAPNPNQKVVTPDQPPRPQRRPNVPQPGEMASQRVTPPLESQRNAVTTDTSAPEPTPQTPQVTRQTTPPDTPQQRSAAAALSRSQSRHGITPRSDVQVADKPAIARENEPSATQPNNTAARKQRSRSVAQRQRVTLPAQTMPSEATPRRRTLQQPAPSRSDLARTPEAVESQRPRLTTRPNLTSQVDTPADAVAPQPNAAGSQPTAQEVTSQRTAVPEATEPARDRRVATSTSSRRRELPASRRRATAESSQPETAAVSETLPGRRPTQATAVGSQAQHVSPVAEEATARTPATPAPSAVAATRAPAPKIAAGNTAEKRPLPSVQSAGAANQPQTARRHLKRQSPVARPSVSALAAADTRPRKAERAAKAPRSPTAAENPVRSSATPTAQPSMAPSLLAVNKGQVGTAGRGAAPNLATADPAAESPANIASGSAERRKATQKLDPGPALAPQAPALVRHGRAGQLQPSAVLKATPSAPATLAGSQAPDPANASASAALSKAASNAQQGQLTAAKGTVEVDIGPTTRVTQPGIARASGGGQPRRSAGIEPRPRQRVSHGKLPSASLLAEDVSPDTRAPISEGGGEPSLAELENNPNASVNTRRTDHGTVLGGPEAAAGGEIAAPTRSLATSDRRAATAADGPQLAEFSSKAPAVGRKAERNHQLESESGVADLSLGNAGGRDARQAPAARLAANAAASDLDKQSAGGVKGTDVGKVAVSAPETETGDSRQAALSARAEAANADDGPPLPGGGTDSPLRSASAPELATNTHAEIPRIAGAETSSGRKNAEPQSTQGPLITRLAGGIDAPRSTIAVGAIPSELAADADEGPLAGTGSAERAVSSSTAQGPDVQSDRTASPSRKKTSPAISVSPDTNVALNQLPVTAAARDEEDLEPGPVADAPSTGSPSRLAGSPMPVAIAADEGPGGLDRQVTVEVGVQDRRASEENDKVLLNAARFARQDVGGMPELDTTAVVATEPFRRRVRREEETGGPPAAGAGPETEEAIELGLVYLRDVQTTDGRWTLDCAAEEDGLPQLSSDTAATGLALLAFQGAGYNHREHRYARVVEKGIEFLIQGQQPNGDLYMPMDKGSNRVVAYYSHGIAALALSEAYGMTQDPALREPAQKALDFIVETQHPKRGGWRYSRHIGSDTSVTGWMMMALKSGDLANLKVPDDTYTQIREWLDHAQLSAAKPHLYCYNPYAPDTPEQRRGRLPTPSMTSVGLLMRLYSGWQRKNPHMVKGAEHLLETPPQIGTSSNPLRDTYYWYYATQVMFHMGGKHWNAWNQRLHPLLIRSQIREGEMAGSWDPEDPVPDRWAPFAGRLYVTTMNLLSLEVTYRHLPLYEDTAR